MISNIYSFARANVIRPFAPTARLFFGNATTHTRIKFIFCLSLMLFSVGTHAAHIANVDYIHQYIFQTHGITVPINETNVQRAANVKYLLCAVDRVNEQFNSNAPQYCSHSLATTQAVDTIAVHDAVGRLVKACSVSKACSAIVSGLLGTFDECAQNQTSICNKNCTASPPAQSCSGSSGSGIEYCSNAVCTTFGACSAQYTVATCNGGYYRSGTGAGNTCTQCAAGFRDSTACNSGTSNNTGGCCANTCTIGTTSQICISPTPLNVCATNPGTAEVGTQTAASCNSANGCRTTVATWNTCTGASYTIANCAAGYFRSGTGAGNSCTQCPAGYRDGTECVSSMFNTSCIANCPVAATATNGTITLATANVNYPTTTAAGCTYTKNCSNGFWNANHGVTNTTNSLSCTACTNSPSNATTWNRSSGAATATGCNINITTCNSGFTAQNNGTPTATCVSGSVGYDVPGTIPPPPSMTVLETWNHAFNGSTVATHGTGINGTVQSRTLPAGTYLLEVWGADGGGRINDPSQFPAGGTMFRGGNGGYSRGILTLTAQQTVYIYVGGAGGAYGIQTSGTNHPGGWNGGGGFRQGSSAGGDRMGTGGGASDIRTTGGAWDLATSLNTRFIVSGGGGGEASWTSPYLWTGGWGGNGGGDVAQEGHHQPIDYSSANGGQPGTQTSSPHSWPGTNDPLAAQTIGDNIPGFGKGGSNGTASAAPGSNNIRSGGGGGWFGGMSGSQRSAGGGSGFVKGLNQGGENLCTAPAWATLTHGGNGHYNWGNGVVRPAAAGRHGYVRISRITLN